MATKEDLKQAAESNLVSFIELVHPMRVLGGIHREVCSWWEREDASTHQLLLLPRDHMKSALVAYRVAYYITKDPTLRVLYISSTTNLAQKQLKFIKDILTSPIYKMFWPDMVDPEEGKREKWTETEFAVDHPNRKKEAIRDPTVFAAGLTTTITGMHCDIAVMDDVVVKENAFTNEGREKVQSQYSLLSSIEGADAREWVVGTRYHPNDLYNDLQNMSVDQYNEGGEIVSQEPLYEIMERQVENMGDGTGEFLWPRQQRYDGKWFGFNRSVLARKRAQYLDKMQFRAQYYNDPNDPSAATVSRDLFQYYDKKHLTRRDGKWFMGHTPINVFASVDFAYSLKEGADYTAIAVVGCTPDNDYYVLDIDRFKTDKISEYYKHILNLHVKWDFRKLRAEVTAGQSVIVKDIKENYIRPNGLSLSIEEFKPTRHLGTKQERIEAILQPRYANQQVWHYHGGNCQILEDELVLQNPPHDDVKDALASCIDICVPPSNTLLRQRQRRHDLYEKAKLNRFGGIA